MSNLRAIRPAWTAGLIAMISLTISGCNTPISTTVIDPEQERTIGDWAAAQIQSETAGPQDPRIIAIVSDIGDRLEKATNLTPAPRILISDSNRYNVASLPGGWIVVSSSTVSLFQADPDELAGLIAHEFAHVAHDDALKQMTNALGPDSMLNMTTQGKYTEASNVAVQLMNYPHDAKDELRADSDGVRYAALAGYDPHGIANAISVLEKVSPASDAEWLDVHRVTSKRLSLLNQDIAACVSLQPDK